MEDEGGWRRAARGAKARSALNCSGSCSSSLAMGKEKERRDGGEGAREWRGSLRVWTVPSRRGSGGAWRWVPAACWHSVRGKALFAVAASAAWRGQGALWAAAARSKQQVCPQSSSAVHSGSLGLRGEKSLVTGATVRSAFLFPHPQALGLRGRKLLALCRNQAVDCSRGCIQ